MHIDRSSGVSLSESGMSAGDLVEGYVDERHLADLVEAYLLDEARASQGNLILHVVPHDVDDLAAAVPVNLGLLLAADLVQHGGPREIAQALHRLDSLLDLEHSGRLARYGSARRD